MTIQSRLWRQLCRSLAYLLPPACSACSALLADHPMAQAVGWCSDCLAQVIPPGPAACPICAQPYHPQVNSTHLCRDCLQDPPPFTRVHAVGRYQDVLQDALHRYKYRGQLLFERPLACLLNQTLARTASDYRPDLVVAVPLHAERLRQRGFNQAHQLAKAVARQHQAPTATRLLQRQRPTSTQQGLKRAERQRNLRGAFALTEPLHGQRILLVDDVMTTGATARECGRTLLNGGAGEVQVAVIGRA